MRGEIAGDRNEDMPALSPIKTRASSVAGGGSFTSP
jgi:hypothetical protein